MLVRRGAEDLHVERQKTETRRISRQSWEVSEDAPWQVWQVSTKVVMEWDGEDADLERHFGCRAAA